MCPTPRTLEKHGFEIKTNDKQGESFLSEKELAELEQKIKAIPQDTHKAKLPAILNPILKEIAGLSHEQAYAILKHTIGGHFGLTLDELRGYEKTLKRYRREAEETKTKKLSQEDLVKTLTLEEDARIVHPAQDFSDGVMSFAVKIKKTHCLVTSDKRLYPFEDTESQGIILKHADVDTTRFSYKGIHTFIEDNSTVSIPDVYRKVYNYIKMFIHFPEEAYLVFLTLWVIGTYLFMVFRYYPYVSVECRERIRQNAINGNTFKYIFQRGFDH